MPEPMNPEVVIAGGVRLTRDAVGVMRDGTALRADIYRPSARGSYPVILMRVPYNKSVAQSPVYQHPSWYARQGYVVVVQDCRGRFSSDGEFDPLRNEAHDGFDSVEWAARVPESNGRVGMYGFSYAGATQLLAAAEQPPALKCCIPAFTASDYFDGWMYENGALKLSFVMSWAVQMLSVDDAMKRGGDRAAARMIERLQDFPAMFRQRPYTEFPLFKETGVAPYFFEWLEHDTRDEYWKNIGLETRYDDISVPCLHIGGWYDVFAKGTIANYAELSRRAGDDPDREQRLIMGPWIHFPWAPEATGSNLGESFANRIDLAQLAWFDRWLKSSDGSTESRVSHFVMGRNEWRSSEDWPPKGSRPARLFLESGGRANSRSGDGRLSPAPMDEEAAPDVFIYDPNNPVMSAGGNSCCNAQVSPMGQSCQAAVESRNEVLVYSTPPLSETVEINGSPTVRLFVSTTALDTDWVVRLTDVDDQGQSYNITQGIMRARYSGSLERPHLLEPHLVHEIEIDMHPTSWLFQKGHRIRLQVTSSDFPNHDPNLNTGLRNASGSYSDAVVAIQTVFHDRRRRSSLSLPISHGSGDMLDGDEVEALFRDHDGPASARALS